MKTPATPPAEKPVCSFDRLIAHRADLAAALDASIKKERAAAAALTLAHDEVLRMTGAVAGIDILLAQLDAETKPKGDAPGAAPAPLPLAPAPRTAPPAAVAAPA